VGRPLDRGTTGHGKAIGASAGGQRIFRQRLSQMALANTIGDKVQVALSLGRLI